MKRSGDGMTKYKTGGIEVNLRGYSVIHVYSDSPREWNTSQWRALTPSNALNTRPDLGWKSKLIHVSGAMNFLDDVVQGWIGPADLIIYERNAITPRALAFIQYWQGMGKPVVINLDDAYWMLPYSNPARPFWFEKEHPGPDGVVVVGGATKMLEEALRQSDGLVAPNALLLNDYAHLAPNGYLLQNYAEWDWWSVLPGSLPWQAEPSWRPVWENWRDPDGDGVTLMGKNGETRRLTLHEALKESIGWAGRTVIGWGGSLSHYDSWHGAGVLPAIGRITERHPELLWVVCGNDGRVHEHLPVPNRNKAHQPGVPPEFWPVVLRTFDLGLAPLTGIYDQRRSWIKGIEYALAGCPWVGTDGETYKEFRTWPAARLGPENALFWEDAIEAMLEDLDGMKALAASLVPEARQRYVASENLNVFAKTYGEIIRDFSDDRAGLPGVYVIEKGKVSHDYDLRKNGREENEDGEENEAKIDPLPNVIAI
jgi:hypothetical protein